MKVGIIVPSYARWWRGQAMWDTLEQAKKAGIHGGSAFRAIAGFGRHGILHEQHFFELAGDLTVKIEFLLTEEEAQRLLDLIQREQVRVFYARVPAEFAMTEGKD